MFRIFVALLPFSCLGLIELGCRLRGFGGYPPVILHVGEDGTRHWYATHRPGTNTFFDTRRSHTGGMREIHFTSPKPPGAVRIVFIGGSAIQGFPQQLPLTNGSFLEAMLQDVWGPTRRAEVLNFGATAVASFPVMCFLDEILDHDPDLVVVMSGNNEFYGAYGMASLHSAGQSPAAMHVTRWARKLGLIQWFNSLAPKQPLPSGTLMELVAVDQQIGPDDRRRAAAERSLRTHLTAIVRRCTTRGVPVILCTLPTNERGLAPIGEDIEPPWPADRKETFAILLSAAEECQFSDPARAAKLAREATMLHDGHARAHFLLGQALTRMGRHGEALIEYVKARDLDAMPWRATSASNRAVRTAAQEGGILCDMEAEFRAQSPGGAIGWELMDDHVHMSLRGQALFAETLVRVLATMPAPLHVDPQDLEHLPDWRVYAHRLGQSIYTDYVAATRLEALLGIPFMQRHNRDAFERLSARREALLSSMSDRDRLAVERWHDPGLHGYTDCPLSLIVGVYRMEDGDYETAAALFRVARATVPAVSLWRLQSTWYLLRCHRRLHEKPTQDDVRLCQQAIEIGELLTRLGGADDHRVQRYLGLAYNLMGNHPAAVACLEGAVRRASGEEGWEVAAVLVDSYVQLHRIDEARALLNLALQDPQMAEPARRLLRQIDELEMVTGQTP